ncbi:hypothetical protein NQD34_010305 [Periophthalmus magnuspinnatus]|nr:hypothetical protein NQD34_010305 [Periophthalmus magnuspinnatus]
MVNGQTFIQPFSTFKPLKVLHFTSRNHSPIRTHIHTPMYADTGGLSVLPKDTMTAIICGSRNRTGNLWASGSDRSAEEVYIESGIQTASLWFSGQLSYCRLISD